MAKPKLRYREKILSVLQQAGAAVSLKNISRGVFSKEESKNQKLQRALSDELRYLIRLKEVEKGSGGLYRIRSAKSVRPKQKHFDDRDSGAGNETFTHTSKQRENRNRKNKSAPIRGRVIKNNRGFAFVAPENPPPFLKEDVFLNPEEAEDLLTGDIVEIQLDATRSDRGYSGTLLRVIERGLQKIMARYIKGNAYTPSMAEVDTKDLQIQIQLDNDPVFKDLVDGAAIVVDVTHPPKAGKSARGKILNVLADSLNCTTDDPHIILKHKLRETFPDAVMAEAESIPSALKPQDYENREDLRNLPFVTIDGADARDFDDAVCSKKLPNGSYRLWVAVADVAHYVRPGTELDREAYERGTSVYFPHRVLPMLPERLSNGICSLNPNEDRLAMVSEIEYDSQGKKIKSKVYEAVFRSQHRCVYESLQNFFDHQNETGHEYNPNVKDNLLTLLELYNKVLQVRKKRGSVDLNLPEAKVKVNRETGEVETIIRTERMDTHRLIEEFMIAANESVSEVMEEHKQAFIFRVHERPDEDAAKRFLDVAQTLHVKVNERWLEDITPQGYQRMVKAIETSPSARVLNFLLLRSMKQAYYTSENLMHFGLASTAYTHFTSPIRRYPDLMVHRLLKAWIHKSKKDAALAKGSVAEDLEEAAKHCSVRERVAVDAERELIRIKQVRYAERHLGEEHSGTVVGINAKGAYIELTDVFVEGFVPIERFGSDFVFNDRLYHLIGKRSGKIIQIGDEVHVQIVRTTPHLLQIELEPLNGKAARKPKIEIQKPELAKQPEKAKPKLPANRDFWTPEDFE